MNLSHELKINEVPVATNYNIRSAMIGVMTESLVARMLKHTRSLMYSTIDVFRKKDYTGLNRHI